MKTATGNFPLGWRRRDFAWEQDLDGMIAWAIENELEVIDLGRDADSCIKAVAEAGLRVGTADLTIWGENDVARCRQTCRSRGEKCRLHQCLCRGWCQDVFHLHASGRSFSGTRGKLRLYGRELQRAEINF